MLTALSKCRYNKVENGVLFIKWIEKGLGNRLIVKKNTWGLPLGAPNTININLKTLERETLFEEESELNLNQKQR